MRRGWPTTVLEEHFSARRESTSWTSPTMARDSLPVGKMIRWSFTIVKKELKNRWCCQVNPKVWSKVSQVVKSLKYGCDLVHFTHASNTIVYASNKEGKGHAIRYMSLHDNKYLKYFNGHEQKVVTIALKTLLILGPLRWWAYQWALWTTQYSVEAWTELRGCGTSEHLTALVSCSARLSNCWEEAQASCHAENFLGSTSGKFWPWRPYFRCRGSERADKTLRCAKLWQGDGRQTILSLKPMLYSLFRAPSQLSNIPSRLGAIGQE